jgi:hypothetical protein
MKNIEDEAVTALNCYTNSKGDTTVATALNSSSKVFP